MTRISPNDDPSREAIERLRGWDFRMDAGSVEPLLFTAWLREFAEAVFVRGLGDAGRDYWNLHPEVIENVLSGHPEWCSAPAVSGDVGTHRAASVAAGEGKLASQPAASSDATAPWAEGKVGSEQARNLLGAQPNACDALLAATLDRALASLRESYDADMATWRWGRAHVAKFPNPVFSRIPVLRDWIDVAISTSGGFDTVNRGSMTIRDDDHPYEHNHGAGLRIVTDLADPAASRMITAPGQSGNPLSPHFSDLLRRWVNFDYLVPGKAVPVATLTLEPTP
jgi:penicillin amidase